MNNAVSLQNVKICHRRAGEFSEVAQSYAAFILVNVLYLLLLPKPGYFALQNHAARNQLSRTTLSFSPDCRPLQSAMPAYRPDKQALNCLAFLGDDGRFPLCLFVAQ
jgi:hypothetical protein